MFYRIICNDVNATNRDVFRVETIPESVQPSCILPVASVTHSLFVVKIVKQWN
jgi:hypothetical protein